MLWNQPSLTGIQSDFGAIPSRVRASISRESRDDEKETELCCTALELK